MSNKKHIDRIFQESFKDFEVTPNPKLWENIKSELPSAPKTPKTSKLSFFYKLRVLGVAALLVLFISIGYKMVTSGVEEVPVTNSVHTKTKILQPIPDTNASNKGSDQVSSAPSSMDSASKAAVTTQKNTKTPSGNKPIVIQKQELVIPPKAVLHSNKQQVVASTKSVLDSNKNEAYNKGLPLEKKPTELGSMAAKNTIDNTPLATNQVNNEALHGATGTQNTKDSTPIVGPLKRAYIGTGMASKPTKSSQAKSIKTSTAKRAQTSNQKPINTNSVAFTINSENQSKHTAANKQSAVAASANANPAVKPVLEPYPSRLQQEHTFVIPTPDSVQLPLQSIEDAIARLEALQTKTNKESLKNRWQVAANLAPVYYNTMGKGSHIDAEFVSNSKSGETNTSYGVRVAYNITKKFSVRSGFNSLNLSYDTDNVILYNSPSTTNPNLENPLRNITLVTGSTTLSAFSGENLGFQQINNELFNAAISQRLSYYEVPVEMAYKLVNNRFGVHLIGGVSTFFLNTNEVYSEFDSYKTYMGEANNINSVSFSTNVGLGLNYKFTNTFQFNFEPTFKYHVNGYKNTAGNFRPYIIGVYTGFSYQF
ncbi:hypothetical protein ACFSQP_07295 [Bizionia sediminis]|uniref:Outer membrane protein beta-barrel domain-containing protein n=1 Tax=Bizionia sediminis TaxID=1737064 RepID=A0ABW5KTB6_9FLAO